MTDIMLAILILLALPTVVIFVIVRTVLLILDGEWQSVYWHDCGWMGDIMAYDIDVCPGCGQSNPLYTKGPAKRRWLWGWKTK